MRVSVELKRSTGCIQRTLRGSSGYFAFAALTRRRWPEAAGGNRPQPPRGAPEQQPSRLRRLYVGLASLLCRGGAGRQPPEGHEGGRFVVKDWYVALTSSLDGSSSHEGWEIDPDEEWEMEVRVERD
ncbi:uncharacterized protein SOCE26_103110 [Sorangium cellulosum]|uniref:Uncharacterized protein n=1 Tax=Sorangium cellulosum TaxID=56 RepID=A0A2L0FB11_SORCE|nr:uncharacterized protein SOCE26_103110 [Sorangium cellulosum]